MKIALYSITSVLMQLSVTLPHHEKSTYLSKKFFFETLSSGGEYRNSCKGVFYKSKGSGKCLENSRIQRLLEHSFVEPEAEGEATGFPL